MARLAGAVVLFALVGSASADISVSIQNLCETTIQLYDNSATTPLAAGATTSRTLVNGYVGMFRHTSSEQATLAEISVDVGTGRPWYDISIIPPGPGTCGSLSACKAATGKVGFNVAMQITPLTNVGTDTCATVTCMADGCADAYSYPADDTKTHNCPSGTNFQLTFCPGGAGGETSMSTMVALTAAPTTAAPTPEPTPAPTPAPTPEPTPTPTSSTVELLAAASSGASGSNSTTEDTTESGSTAANEGATIGFDADATTAAGSGSDSDFAIDTISPITAAPAATTAITDAGDATAAAPATSASPSSAAGADSVTAPATATDTGAVQANTQSSAASSSSGGLVVALVVGAVMATAATVIFVVRKKTQALDQLDDKNAMPTPAAALAANRAAPRGPALGSCEESGWL